MSSSSSTRCARGAGSPPGGSAHVQEQKRYNVRWRFISPGDPQRGRTSGTPEYQAVHQAGLRALRVADQVRLDHGNDAVAAYYTALGTKIHVERRREELVGDTVTLVAEALSEAGLPTELTEHLDDDAPRRRTSASETELALVAHRARRRHADPHLRPRTGRARGQLLRAGDLQGAPRCRGRQARGTPSRRSPRRASPSSSAACAPSPTSPDPSVPAEGFLRGSPAGNPRTAANTRIGCAVSVSR